MPAQTDPAQVGDYELLATIGEGGMGVVHLGRARDGRRVAVKVLRPQVVGDLEARERLAREVASLQRVRSSRVAEVLDADPWGPTPFVVTRYVPGLSLHDHVREEGPIEGADLHHLATTLAQAVLDVHAVGVLHRDIKPSNVLMEGRSPVLIDFGLARLSDDPRLTHTGWLLGTPGYLAPELLYGDDATPAADVHAWAATVVFAAVGRSPYGKGQAMAVLDRVRLGQHDLTGVPEQLRPLLEAALATEPTDRPTMAEVHDFLTGRREMKTARSAGPKTGAVSGPMTAPIQAAVSAPRQPTRPEAVAPSVVPGTRVMPADEPRTDRFQRLALMAALIALTSGLVALAPYVGLALVAIGVILLRTISVTGERHGLRRIVRGHPKWYDVPATGVSTPWYLLIGAFGALTTVLWGALAAVATGALLYLAHVRHQPGLLVMGLVFTIAMWWGPGSTRLRAVTRGYVWRASTGGGATWFVAVLLALAGLVCAATLMSKGAIWAPLDDAPWNSGFLADVLQYF